MRPLEVEPRFPEIFFPGLLEYASLPEFEWSIYALCLRYFESKLLTPGAMNAYLAQVLASYEAHERFLVPVQQPNPGNWMWEETYSTHRSVAALLLDLLGYFPNIQTLPVLDRAMTFSDPRLKHDALISLLRLGQEVDALQVAAVARSSEMRIWLYRKLAELQALEYYPDEYLTQSALAESDMVNWLMYPTELGRPPDEIELGKVVAVDTESDDGRLLYFVFRFRNFEPDWAAKNGWMAGVSGPFLERDAPSPTPYSGTFSAFEAWDSRSPEEHLGEIDSILEQWRAHRGQG
jgi:hypothetical protein